MLQENLIKIYETSFRDNREMPALTDYFKGETFSYYEMAKEVADLHAVNTRTAFVRNYRLVCAIQIVAIKYGF